MTSDPQATFVVEYPCDRFCRIEVDLTGAQSQVTVQQIRGQADVLHQREHDPAPAAEAEAEEPVVDQEASRRPAATVFLSAPGRDKDRRR